MIFAFFAFLILAAFGLSPLVVPLYTRRFYKGYSAYPEQKYRTFWPRLWASYTDGVILFPVGLILQYYVTLEASFWENMRWLFVIVLIVNTAYWWVYTIYMHGRFGQTVGKRSTYVRVVDAKTEEPITFKHALIRDSIPLVILAPLLIYESYRFLVGLPIGELLIGTETDTEATTSREIWTSVVVLAWWVAECVTMLTNDKRRAVHDYIAGTVVVRTDIEGQVHIRKAFNL